MTTAQLQRSVGLLGVVMLGAGTAIGVSIFSVLEPAANVAGSGLLIAVMLAAVPMVLFAVVYAFMASALPKSGASFEWPSQFVHPLAGFMVAWLRILGSVGVMITLATVMINYLSGLVALPPGPTKFALITFIFVINLLGVSVAARAQTVMMLVLLVVLAIFVAAGLPSIRFDRIGDPFASGWLAILAAVPLMITLFLGIEAATEIGEEVKDAERTIPRGISLAVMLTATVYVAVAVTALGLLGPAGLAASEAPLLDAARGPLGMLAVPLILGAATIAMLKTLNSTFLIFSRYLFAMGRAGVLPMALARIHPRFGTPHVACLVAFLCGIAGLFMPSDLVFLLLAVNIPTMLKYLATCLCAWIVVARHPDIYAAARLKLARPMVKLLAALGMACAVAVVLVGLNADWRPYLLILAWGGLGLIYWAMRRGAMRRLAHILKGERG